MYNNYFYCGCTSEISPVICIKVRNSYGEVIILTLGEKSKSHFHPLNYWPYIIGNLHFSKLDYWAKYLWKIWDFHFRYSGKLPMILRLYSVIQLWLYAVSTVLYFFMFKLNRVILLALEYKLFFILETSAIRDTGL